MNFIKDLFEGRIGNDLHNQFVRFGKGVYENRAVYEIALGKQIKLSTGFEYTADLIEFIIKNLPENEVVNAKGTIFCREDAKIEAVKTERKTGKKKGFILIFVDEELSIRDLKKLYTDFRFEYLLLNIKARNVELKTGAKPHSPRGKYNEKFNRLMLGAEFKNKITGEYAFDCPDVKKKLSARHVFEIEGIEIPKEYQSDALKSRLNGLRYGTAKRIIIADGEEKTTEIKFKI